MQQYTILDIVKLQLQPQVLKSKHFPLSFASSLLATEPEVRVLLLVRDPRGVLTHSKQVGHADT